MTYGENSAALRTELGGLLRQHRIQQRLGGAGTSFVPVTTTVDERLNLGRQIARYRRAVLAWCLHAAEAATPPAALTSPHAFGPADELRRHLEQTLSESDADYPSLDDLTTVHEFAIVDSWRKAARSAALGEHDFDTVQAAAQRSLTQAATLRTDAAQITRALIILDERYTNTPGWKTLPHRGSLSRATSACMSLAAGTEPDYTIDLSGWRPPRAADAALSPTGIDGVIEVEQRLLATLGKAPDARTLRLILDSQRNLSHVLASRAGTADPKLVERWAQRRHVYDVLVDQSTDIRGLIGSHAGAAVAAIAANRAQALAPNDLRDLNKLRQLNRVLNQVDDQLAKAIQLGVSGNLYFQRVKLPRVTHQTEGLVHPVRERYIPVRTSAHPEVIATVQSQLRARAERPRPPDNARQGRLAFEADLAHRPQPRGEGPCRSL